MNIVFVKNNYISLLFLGLFNFTVYYLFYTKQFEQYERNLLAYISIYEFLNIFIEIKNNLIRKESQIILYLLHHATTTFICGFFYYYYESNVIYHDISLYSAYLTLSTFYLNLQYVFPGSNVLKIIFVFSFFYYRMILTFPLYVKMVKGFYIIEKYRFVSIFCSSLPIFFFCLNLYWGILILNKFKNKLNKCLRGKKI